MNGRRALAAAAASGVLLGLSLPDYDVWPLAWLGLTPLLLAVRGQTAKRAFTLGWVAWFVFSLLVLYWIAPTISNYTRIAAPLAVAVLILLCATSALFIGAFAALLEWLGAAGISRVVAAPALWVVGEWLRTFFPAEFPWAFLGYSQYSILPVIQIADLTAIYGVSALLVFVNAALAEVARDGPRRHGGLLIAAAAAITLDLVYGAVRLHQVAAAEVRGHLPVGVVQGNIPQEEKWDPAIQNQTLERYLGLSRKAIDEGARLVVWPEAALPFFFGVDRRGLGVIRFADDTKSWLLIGAPGFAQREGGPPRQYNEAWLIGPGHEVDGPYDKMILVPFGEYVPFGGLFGWVHEAVEAVGEFGRGERPVVFKGPEIEVEGGSRAVGLGPLICYEGIFPGLVRRFVAGGADLLVNISNDAWYGRTSAPYQHVAMAALRAVENRVPMVRATNTGVSAVVDPSGWIHERTALFEEAAFVDTIAITDAGSPYTRVGDVFVYACIAVVLGLAFIRVRLGSVLIRG